MQIFSMLFDKFRNNILIHQLPLIRITVKLRDIDCKKIDKCLKFVLVCLQHTDILIIIAAAMLCRNRINSSAHLFFFVIIQIDFCQSIDVFFEFFIIVKHRLLPPINNKKLPEGNFLPMKIYSELFLCLSIFSRSCKSLNA